MIRATDIKQGRIVASGVVRVDPMSIPPNRGADLEIGDVIVVRSGAYTGDLALYDGGWQRAIAGYDLVVSPHRDRVLAKYLAFYMRGRRAQAYFRSQRDRSAQPHLNADQLGRLQVLVPPFAAQAAITLTLDAVAGALDARRRELLLELEQKTALRRHVFARGIRAELEVEPGEHALPTNWHVAPLETYILEGPQNGIYKPSSDYGQGSPIVRINDFDNEGRFSLHSLLRIRVSQSEGVTYELRPNDLLINRVNSLSHLGKVALITGLSESTLFESNMMRLRIDDSRLLPEYLVQYMRTPECRTRIRESAKRAVAQSSINQGDIRSLPVPVAPLDEQHEIAAVLSASDSKLLALEREITLHEELFHALLEELLSQRLPLTALIE